VVQRRSPSFCWLRVCRSLLEFRNERAKWHVSHVPSAMM
jgi:hypothetical protein